MRLTFLLIAIFVATSFVAAQDVPPFTELKGTAIDQAGATISDVRIVLTNPKGKKYEVATSDDGSFLLKVPADTYLVEATYQRNNAWEPFRIEKYEVAATKLMTLDICLRIDEKVVEQIGTKITEKVN